MVTRILFLGLLLFCASISYGQSNSSNFDTVIDVPPIVIGDAESVGSGTQVNVADGGTIGRNFTADGGIDVGNTEVNLLGGMIGGGFRAINGVTVNMTDGRLESGAQLNYGSILNLSGGTVGSSFNTFGNSILNITGGIMEGEIESRGTFNMSGGTIGPYVRASGTVNITGGSLSSSMYVYGDSTVSVSGGEVDMQAVGQSQVSITGGKINQLRIDSDTSAIVSGGVFKRGITVSSARSSLELVGIDFTIDGLAITETTTYTGDGRLELITGTLADGSVVIFQSPTSGINQVTITTVAVPDADPTPLILDQSTPAYSKGLRPGQTLTLL